MADDSEVIAQLEKTIGKKLKKCPLDRIGEVTYRFSLDNGGRVVGLNLRNCKLGDITPLQALTKLELLYLSGNELTDLSPLQSLTQLKRLVLNKNCLTDITPLRSLPQLTALYLCNNRLTDIAPLQALTRLLRLDLRNNMITHLPAFITKWNIEIKWTGDFSHFAVHLYGNPLETPPVEIVKQGKEAISNYFAELEKASVLLLQAKLLFVGSGEVGKTTLMKTLTVPGFKLTGENIGKEPSTHGIGIKPWTIDCPLEADCEDSQQITLHTWDFGGQDIYLSTHQFFLTKRSLYIFVWEARKEEESRSFDYWLNVIKLFSDNSPVIVVMNKTDVRSKPIDEAAYADKFKNIKAFLQVSCLDRRGIDQLDRTIREVLGRMPHLKDRLPKSWMDIRGKLEAEGKTISMPRDIMISAKTSAWIGKRPIFSAITSTTWA
jgi:internalin A